MNVAVVEFQDGRTKVRKLVPVSKIRLASTKAPFVPQAGEDFDKEKLEAPYEAKWQQSFDGSEGYHDGYYPAVVKCLSGKSCSMLISSSFALTY